MINGPAGVDVRQPTKNHLVSTLFPIQPGRQRLFHDPGAWAVEPCGGLIDLFGKLGRNVSSEDPGRHGISNHSDWK